MAGLAHALKAMMVLTELCFCRSSRTSTTPPRGPAKPTQAVPSRPPQLGQALHAPAGQQPSRRAEDSNAAMRQAWEAARRQSFKSSQAAASRKRSWQPTSAAPHGFQGHPEPEVPAAKNSEPKAQGSGAEAAARQSIAAGSQPAGHLEAASVQDQQGAGAVGDVGVLHSQQADPVVTAEQQTAVLTELRAAQMDAASRQQLQARPAQDGSSPPDLNFSPISNHGPAAEPSPARSVVSVAALRQSFERRASPMLGLVDGIRPRNRLPLRKASSKAYVVEEDGSPQQAVLLWQQSLRGEGDELSGEPHCDAQHTKQRPHSQKASLKICTDAVMLLWSCQRLTAAEDALGMLWLHQGQRDASNTIRCLDIADARLTCTAVQHCNGTWAKAATLGLHLPAVSPCFIHQHHPMHFLLCTSTVLTGLQSSKDRQAVL